MADNSSPAPAPTGWASLKLLTRYQWFVFIVCCLAWDLDCLDQQLFVLARDPAIASLMKLEIKDKTVENYGGYATAVFLIGWGVGGIGFGVMGDRLGRVKTLTLTIGLYALFTGLSALSVSVTDFMIYRFLTGLGVGGAFAAAVVLLAESVPETARPYILGMFQASSVIGNCTAALIGMLLGSLQKDGFFPPGQWLTTWRLMFLIGIIPGLLLVVVQFSLKEPEKWLLMREAQRAGARQSPFQAFFGTLKELLTTSPWNRRVLFGLLLTGTGVIGLWGIGFFSPRLAGIVFTETFKAEGMAPDQIAGEVTRWRSITSLFQNAGAFFGIFAFSWVTGIIGRRPSFAFFFLCGALSTAATFWFLRTRDDVYWLIPMMGFFQLSVFGGFAIYLPELFPTKYRSTGTSFCYNAGRLLAAAGPIMLGELSKEVFGKYGDDSIRYAGVTMCAVFVLGIAALPFLPETKGKPLPE
ncbi:MAG: MFS transporter [Fimbriiglobus sp.]